MANIHCLTVCFIIFSTRQYTVPDPPGLFDGHVWPMYLKHRTLMENCSLSIGMLQLESYIQLILVDFCLINVFFCFVFFESFRAS